MDLFLTGVFRWVLATLLLCYIIQKSESFRISQKPSNPTIVVLGVNSSLVSLEWRYSDAPPNYFVQFLREKPRETIELISSSKDGNAFEPSSTKEFEASLEATLKLKNVKRNEEYTYTIFLLDTKLQQQGSHAVSIIVVERSALDSIHQNHLGREGLRWNDGKKLRSYDNMPTYPDDPSVLFVWEIASKLFTKEMTRLEPL